MAKTRTIKALADAAKVSVRTLHHYDEIGLLRPSGRSAKGYRLYTDQDLLRLQQILVQRALGLSLEAIGRALDEPGFDLRAALLAQRIALASAADDAARRLRAIDRALARLNGEETDVRDEELFDGFDAHAHEAKAKWGQTEAYAESARRTAGYGPAEWQALKVEQEAIYRDLFAAKTAGHAASHPDVQAIVERHRQSIDRWFYPCDRAMQTLLAATYEADARFAANIDRFGEGLTSFLVAAIRAR